MISPKADSQSFPKISIVTPNYNQGSFLEETILSVLNQDYPNIEYIIVDGGSTDGSVEIIKKYEERLAYWISEPDKGQYDAIQKGFEQSTGQIMTYLNSDDVFHKRSFFTAAEIFLKFPDIRWLNGPPNTIDEEGRLVWTGDIPKWNKYLYLQKHYTYIQQEGIFWQRSLWEEAGGFISREYNLASDLELWSRFFQFAELHYTSAPLASFRMRGSNQRSIEGLADYNKEALHILSKMNRTKEESHILKLRRLWPYRLLRKSFFNFIFRISGLYKIEAKVNKMPAPILFDRFQKSFEIKDSN